MVELKVFQLLVAYNCKPDHIRVIQEKVQQFQMQKTMTGMKGFWM